MNSFLLWGLIAGVIFVLAYIGMVAKAKEVPELDKAIGLIVSALGVTGGVRICWNVLAGNISGIYNQVAKPLSEEDMTYLLIGGFALIWISLDVIVRRFWILHGRTHTLYLPQKSNGASEDIAPLDGHEK